MTIIKRRNTRLRVAVIGNTQFDNPGLVEAWLDQQLLDDPYMILVTTNGPPFGPTFDARSWALKNDVDMSTHVINWPSERRGANRAATLEDIMIAVHTEIVFDADEVLVFWDGDEDFKSLFEIARAYGLPQTIILSNSETECEIYEED